MSARRQTKRQHYEANTDMFRMKKWSRVTQKKRRFMAAHGDLHFNMCFCYDSQMMQALVAMKLNVPCCRVTNG